MKIKNVVTIWEKKENDKGLSVRFTESRKDQNGNWINNGGGWAAVRGEKAVAFVKALPDPVKADNGNLKPIGLFSIEGSYDGYNQKNQDGTYSRGFFNFFSVENLPEKTENAAPAQNQTSTQTQSAEQTQPQQTQASQEMEELPFA